MSTTFSDIDLKSYESSLRSSKADSFRFNQDEWMKLDSRISKAILGDSLESKTDLLKDFDMLYYIAEISLPRVPTRNKTEFDKYESVVNRLHVMDARRKELEAFAEMQD